MPFKPFGKKAPPAGSAAEERAESPAKERAEQKAGKGDNPFAKKMAKGGKVMRGTGAATRGKGTQGVV